MNESLQESHSENSDATAHDENLFRVAAVSGNVVVYAADGLGDIAKACAHAHVGQEL